MNIILVLASSFRHFQEYQKDVICDKNTKLIFVDREDKLLCYRPIAIIRLPEWYYGRTEEFIHKIDVVKKWQCILLNDKVIAISMPLNPYTPHQVKTVIRSLRRIIKAGGEFNIKIDKTWRPSFNEIDELSKRMCNCK